jgi:hypothetical protein
MKLFYGWLSDYMHQRCSGVFISLTTSQWFIHSIYNIIDHCCDKTGVYMECIEIHGFSSQPCTVLCDSCFNIIIPSTSMFVAKCSLHFGFFDSDFVCTSNCLIFLNFTVLLIAVNSTNYEAIFSTLIISDFLCPLYTLIPPSPLYSQIFSLDVDP